MNTHSMRAVGSACDQRPLLKCIDMYRSAELDAQVKQYVDRPSATYAGDEQNGE
jgi:hypothetical protein